MIVNQSSWWFHASTWWPWSLGVALGSVYDLFVWRAGVLYVVTNMLLWKSWKLFNVDLLWRNILEKMSQPRCTVTAIPGSNTAWQHTNYSLIAPVTRQEPQDFLWHRRHPDSVCSASVALHASLFVTKPLIFRGEKSFIYAPSLHVYKPGISACVKVN